MEVPFAPPAAAGLISIYLGGCLNAVSGAKVVSRASRFVADLMSNDVWAVPLSIISSADKDQVR